MLMSDTKSNDQYIKGNTQLLLITANKAKADISHFYREVLFPIGNDHLLVPEERLRNIPAQSVNGRITGYLLLTGLRDIQWDSLLI